MIDIPLRTSPIHDALADRHPRWVQVDGMPAPVSYGDVAAERAQALDLALCDASCLPRMLLKGPGAAAWLAAQGCAPPAEIYEVAPLPGRGLHARTGGAEFLLEDGPGASSVSRLRGALVAGAAGVYEVVRQDAVLWLSGRRAVAVLLETCGYDFRRPAERLVMTRVAGVSCAVWQRECETIPLVQLWLDGTFGMYLWETLLEIVREKGGDAVGLAPFFPGIAPGP